MLMWQDPARMMRGADYDAKNSHLVHRVSLDSQVYSSDRDQIGIVININS